MAATPVPVPEIKGDDLVKEELDGIQQDGSMLGDPEAPYTLVEFGDLVCPPCATYSKDILPPVVEQYVREGKLRIQFQPINLTRDQSALAGQYAWAAAAQDKLWAFVTLWYRNQGDEDVPYVTDDFARAIAAKIPGLEADKLIADAHQPETRRKLDDFARRFVDLSFSVVPSFAAGPKRGKLLAIDLGESAVDRHSGGRPPARHRRRLTEAAYARASTKMSPWSSERSKPPTRRMSSSGVAEPEPRRATAAEGDAGRERGVRAQTTLQRQCEQRGEDLGTNRWTGADLRVVAGEGDDAARTARRLRGRDERMRQRAHRADARIEISVRLTVEPLSQITISRVASLVRSRWTRCASGRRSGRRLRQ